MPFKESCTIHRRTNPITHCAIAIIGFSQYSIRTVRNVVDFGVFVDIGVHQDGLVHISQVCNKFIRHPSEVVSVGDVVKVIVLEVDEKKHRISLSMKQAK